MAPPPPCEFGEDEEEGDGYHGDGPFSAAGGSGYILRFCFGCWQGLAIALSVNPDP